VFTKRKETFIALDIFKILTVLFSEKYLYMFLTTHQNSKNTEEIAETALNITIFCSWKVHLQIQSSNTNRVRQDSICTYT